MNADWALDGVVAPFVYGPWLANYLKLLKYRRRRLLGRPLGRLLAAEVKAARVDFLVPVPMHPRRLRTRTFNHAEELAAAVAARIGVPRLLRGIQRRIHTRPQTELSRSERMQNPVEAFEVSRDLTGLRIAIVDDVITTGATVNALAQALRASGASHVEAWAVARSVGQPG